MKSKISRRSFLRNIAAAGSGAAALGLLAGCSSSSTAASSGSTAAASFPIYIVINIIVHFPEKGNGISAQTPHVSACPSWRLPVFVL